ncbi:MAG TPA: hypothetical protein VFK09_12360 [Gemmatimonadales bacterium]|nr:hypothetical protein [Gemmatimonadales bacterium]
MTSASESPQPVRAHMPLPGKLEELCAAGRECAEYLWQIPGDASVRARLSELLATLEGEVAKTGRSEMMRLARELRVAAGASPSPQQAEILQDGLDRLGRLAQASKSGLF